jgi:hypothetical protein
VFGGNTVFTTDYWTVNGQAYPAACSTQSLCGVTGFGIWFDNTTNGSSYALGFGSNSTARVSNITVKYAELSGPGVLFSTNTDEGMECVGTCNYITLSNNYIHSASVDLLSFNNGNSSGTGLSITYNWLAHNDTAQSSGCGGACHAQVIQTTQSNMTFGNNVVQDFVSSGMITDATGAAAPILSNWYVYNNIIFWDAAYTAADTTIGLGDGLVGFMGTETITGVYFYNNTIYGYPAAT